MQQRFRPAFRPFLPAGLAALVLLAGCAQPAPPPAPVVAAAAPEPATPVHGELVGPARGQAHARVCEVSPGSGAATMRVSSDGGWCSIGYTRANGYAFKGARVLAQPSHGALRVRQLRNGSVVEYEPSAGYAGPDSFTAALAQRSGIYRVVVTVER